MTAVATAPARARKAGPEPTTSLTIPRSLLIEALQRIVLVTPNRATLPILLAVRIARVSGGLMLTATDLDRTLTTILPLDTQEGIIGLDETAPVALPSRRLLDIVSQLPPAPVTLDIFATGTAGTSTAGTKVRISAGRSRFEIPSFKADEFPLQEPVEATVHAELPGAAFLAAIGRALPHTSTEMSRPILNGILLDGSERGLIIAATDSYRVLREVVAETTSLRGQWIIPRAAVPVLAKLFAGAETIRLTGEPKRASFASDTATLDVRLVQGPYPHIDPMLDLTQSYEAVVDRATLSTAVKRMMTLSDVPRVGLTFSPTELVVHAEGDGTGKAEDVIPVKFGAMQSPASQGDRLELYFQPRFVLDVLGSMTAEEVRLEMKDSGRPMYLRDAAQPSGITMGLIMPIRAGMKTAPAPDDSIDGEDANV